MDRKLVEGVAEVAEYSYQRENTRTEGTPV